MEWIEEKTIVFILFEGFGAVFTAKFIGTGFPVTHTSS